MTSAESDSSQPDSSQSESSQQGSENKEPELSDRVDAFLKELRSRSRKLSRAKNILGSVKGKQPDAADYAAWLEVRQGLEGLDMGEPALQELKDELVAQMAKQLERMRIKARMKFVQKLEILAGQRGLGLDKVSESPLVYHAEPLTFEIDFDAGSARVLFGHEPIAEVAMKPAALLDAREQAVEDLEARALDAEAFFDRLHDAYRTVLVADHAEFGERVDLVDVLVPLAVLGAERKRWRREGTDALEPFGRVLLAYQLAGLRAEGVLERNGLRLELGAATGGTTRDKRDVLFVPVGAKGGQYYGSLRFTKA
ncbi:MAG: hypothetical protein ACLFVJ_16150 [Persicimonas sp.]